MRKKAKYIKGNDGHTYRVTRVYDSHEKAKEQYNREHYTVLSTRLPRDIAYAIKLVAISEGKTPSMVLRNMATKYLTAKLNSGVEMPRYL